MIGFDRIKEIFQNGKIGFRIDETMTGAHHFLKGKGPEGNHPMEFRITWGADNLGKWLNPLDDGFMLNTLKGKVDIGGLVVDADCKGTLAFKYFQEQKIIYTFEFQDEKGVDYRFVGEKRDIRPWNLHRTHTTCYGFIAEKGTGEIIAKSLLHFRPATIIPFLKSFKLF